jgi:hypothetical protein
MGVAAISATQSANPFLKIARDSMSVSQIQLAAIGLEAVL